MIKFGGSPFVIKEPYFGKPYIIFNGDNFSKAKPKTEINTLFKNAYYIVTIIIIIISVCVQREDNIIVKKWGPFQSR